MAVRVILSIVWMKGVCNVCCNWPYATAAIENLQQKKNPPTFSATESMWAAWPHTYHKWPNCNSIRITWFTIQNVTVTQTSIYCFINIFQTIECNNNELISSRMLVLSLGSQSTTTGPFDSNQNVCCVFSGIWPVDLFTTTTVICLHRSQSPSFVTPERCHCVHHSVMLIAFCLPTACCSGRALVCQTHVLPHRGMFVIRRTLTAPSGLSISDLLAQMRWALINTRGLHLLLVTFTYPHCG